MICAFRFAAAVYVICACILLAKAFSGYGGNLPAAGIEYWNWWAQQPRSAAQYALEWVTVGAMIASVAAALAMSLFNRFARVTFWLCVTMILLCEPFAELPLLVRPIEGFLQSLLGLAAGAAIGLAYSPAIREHFGSNRGGGPNRLSG